MSGSQSSSGLTRRSFLAASGALLATPALAAALEQIPAPEAEWVKTTDTQIRIGVVGGRFGLAFHSHEHPNCVVHAVSDLLPERRDALKKKYACDLAYESLEKLVLDPDVDAVAVFTPAPDHARHVQLCMENGKHVISACPACMTLDEAHAMAETQRKTGMRYMSAETSYYRWETQAARRLFAEGAFGEMVYCEAEYYHPGIGRATDGLSTANGERTWRWGFPPMLYPTHSTAFLVGVTGERLTAVSCIGTGATDEPALKDNAYDNPFLNGMALFETDKGHPFRCNVAWNIEGHGERAQWFGDHGALYMPGPAGQPFIYRSGSDQVTVMPDYFPTIPEAMRYDSGHGRSHPFLTNEFIMALAEDRAPAIDLEMALAFCVPGIVAHQSALNNGERLQIPQIG